MLKSSSAMGIATLTSRLLGMVREMVYARFMGDGWVAGAFVLAFMIPNLFRRLLGEGALTAAFVPMFKDKERNAGEDEMWRAANAVISALVVVTGALVIVGIGGVSLWIVVAEPEGKSLLMLQLLRVMFPYLSLVCLAAVLMAMLNARGHFFIPAMGATMLNVVMIASVLLLAPRFGATLPQQIFALAVGVLVAGCIQAAFQLPALAKEGFRYRWVTPWREEAVLDVARKMIPGTIGVAAFQINVLVTQGIAFQVGDTVVASFNYAVRLMELPQGVFGISLATFLLPALSGLAAEKDFAGFRSTLLQGVGYLVCINLLASVLLVVQAEPIVRLLFERGQFGPDATERAGTALACLAPGLVAFSIVNVMARAFYALGDTSTPMKISLVCLSLNLVFVMWMIGPFRQAGLGIANTLSAVINVVLLGYALRRKFKQLDYTDLFKQTSKLLLPAAVAGGIAWGGTALWIKVWGSASVAHRIGAVFAPMVLATAAYAGLALMLKVPAAQEVLDAVRRRSSRSDEGAG
jgi:putative peptidoglycan lipid II flippase